MSKRRIKNEAFENIQRTVKVKDDITSAGDMGIVMKDAYDDSIKTSDHVEKINKDLEKKAKDVITDDPDTGKEIKNDYTAKLTLDESFDDFKLSEDSIKKKDGRQNRYIEVDDEDEYLDYDMYDFITGLVTDTWPKPLNPLKKSPHKFQYTGQDDYEKGIGNKGESQIGTGSNGEIIVYGTTREYFDDAIAILDYYEIEHSDVRSSINKNSHWPFYMNISTPMISSDVPMMVEDYLTSIGMTLEEAMPADWCKQYRKKKDKEEKEKQKMINDRAVQKMVNKAITDAANNDEDFDVLLKNLYIQLDTAGLQYSRKTVRDRFMSEFI